MGSARFGAADAGLVFAQPFSLGGGPRVAALPITVARIVVKRDRLVCDVRVTPGFSQEVTPRLAAAVRTRFPQIEGHACVNEVGDTFGAVMDRASLPHLLEHLVIQLQAEAWERASPSNPLASPGAFVGVTEWVDREEGIARIQLGYRDDMVALAGLRDAVAFVNESL